MTADDTTPARVAAAAEVIATNRRRWAIEDGTTPPLNDLTLRDLELAAAVVAALDAEPRLHILMEFGCEEHDCTPERFPDHYHRTARAAGGPDDGTAERALARLLPLADELEAACDANVPMTNRREREAARALIREVRAAADTGHQGGES